MISNEAMLAQFQLWRIGADERTLDEIGLTPANISSAINGVLKELTQLKQQRDELFNCLKRVMDETEVSYAVNTLAYDAATTLLQELEGRKK